MIRIEQDNTGRAPMIIVLAIIFLLGLPFGARGATSANVSTTVTVAPRVEALTATTIPLGSSTIYPGETSVTILTLSVRNTYLEAKSLTSLTVHDASRGAGTPAELLSNLDSLFLYKDIDGDSLLSAGDSLVSSADRDAADVAMAIGGLEIGTDSVLTLLVAARTSVFPHDGDTVDLFVRPAVDIESGDGTPVAGGDSLNSLGVGVIDGMVAAQLNTLATGLTSIGTGDTVYNVFTVDVPRNGYAADTLESFTIHNAGTADETDLEFMVLFSDNGNGVWGGLAEENLIAPLEYIGGHWAASDLDVPLTAATTRLFVGGKTLPYPVNGATLVLNIPEYGLLVASRNDGPLDTGTEAVDTIEIQSEEGLLLTSVVPDADVLIPGQISAPVFAFEVRNGSPGAVDLDSAVLQLDLVDPSGGASASELESQIDSLMLYRDGDGDPTTIGVSDVLVATSSATDGPCLFSTGGMQIDAGGNGVAFSVVVAVNLDSARDGNTVSMSLEAGADVFVTPGTTIFGSFPQADAPTFPIDAFPAQKVAVTGVASVHLYGGQADIPIFDFVVPGNGYAADTLEELVVENIGNVDDAVAVSGLKLWRDITGDGFTVDDNVAAGFIRGASTWSASGFGQPIPSDGQRMILTVSISDDQFDGGTLALSIPAGAMRFASGMDGPDDEAITDGNTHLIIPPQRITVVSVPTASTTVNPGRADNTVLTFALYNGYMNESKTMRSVRLRNISRSASGADFADHEIGRVRLFYDADANRLLSGDPLIGSGYFQDGVLNITGLSLSLPPESLAYFFVQSDVTDDAIDFDSLGLSINGIADFEFAEEVNINGDLPLTSGGWQVVDGSVKCQYEVIPMISQSVTPGDALVPLMTFRPASNGDQSDTLVSVTVSNLGTADTTDITNLKLWVDNDGDDIWQLTDVLIGNFAYTGSSWGTGGFALEVGPIAPTLFVTGDIQPGGTDGRTVNLSIPVGGCLYLSDNDGPIDSSLTSGSQFTLTGSNLRVAHRPHSGNYSVGETIEVEFSATNLSGSVMDSVVGLSNLIGDPTRVQLDSVFFGPVSLAASDSTEFSRFYTALQAGTVSWSVQAADLVMDDTSSLLFTEPCYIQWVPSSVGVDFVSSMPATVTLGQKNIIPMTLSFAHGDTSPATASVRLDSLRLTVTDGSGNSLAADAVFSRVRVITDEMHAAEPGAVPSSDVISFVFDHPMTVDPADERSLSVVVEIDSLATATDFALSLSAASSAIFRDVNSGSEVTLLSASGFPLTTTAAQIDRPPDQLLVAALDREDLDVNRGQINARLLRLALRHPGTPGTAAVQCTELSIEMEDDANQPVDFSDAFEQLKVVHRGNVVAIVTGESMNSSRVTISLASPPILGAGETDTLDLLVDLLPSAQLRQLRLMVADSTEIAARNFSTGEDIPVSIDTDLETQGASFPLYSGWFEIKYPAGNPLVCLSTNSDSTVLAGADNVSLVEVRFAYPVSDAFSGLRLQNMALFVLDTNGRALDPQILFHRIGYIRDNSAVVYQNSVVPVSGQAVFEFGDDGIVLEPSDTLDLWLVVDVDSDIPFDHFVFFLESPDDIRLRDATDSLRQPQPEMMDGCVSSIPFEAGPFSVLWPAGRPTIQSNSEPLAMAAAGQRNVRLVEASLDYHSLIPQGDLIFDSFRGELFKRTPDGLTAVPGSALFDAVRIRVDEVTWAADSSLATSTTLMWSAGDCRVEPNSAVQVRLEADLRSGAPVGNYVFVFADSTFMSFIDENVDTTLYPILSGASYPLLSTELCVQAADLAGSFSNFPNPFIPTRDGVTNFAYALSEDAHVSIVLYSSTGEKVVEVVDNVLKPAGSYFDEDNWDGRNDRGLEVAPGTYLCVITADYVSGGQESVKRKVTVVR